MVVPLAFGWRHLLFANWSVDADRLADHLPDALAVDEYDGAGWLSAVAFANVDTRPRGLPRWAGVRLPELNLRTYVTCEGDPGVYFFSLDAPSALAVGGARLTHHLPYYYARVRLQRVDDGVVFESRRRHPRARPARFAASYRPDGEPFSADPGSRAAFLSERRRLYTQASDGTLRYTDVDHPPWTLYPAAASIRENTLFAASGFAHPGGEPTLYYSPGVDVVASRSRRWDEEP